MEKKLCFFEVATKKLKKFIIQYISLCNVKTCFWSLLNFERFSSYEAFFSEHKNSTNTLIIFFDQFSPSSIVHDMRKLVTSDKKKSSLYF